MTQEELSQLKLWTTASIAVIALRAARRLLKSFAKHAAEQLAHNSACAVILQE